MKVLLLVQVPDSYDDYVIANEQVVAILARDESHTAEEQLQAWADVTTMWNGKKLSEWPHQFWPTVVEREVIFQFLEEQ